MKEYSILKSESEVKRSKVKKVLSIIGAGVFTIASIATFILTGSYPDVVTQAIGGVIGGVGAAAGLNSLLMAKKHHDEIKSKTRSLTKAKLKSKGRNLKLAGVPVLIAGVLAVAASAGYLGAFKYGMANDDKQAIANENHTTIEEVSSAQELKDMGKDLGFTILGVGEGMAAAIAGGLSIANGRKLKKKSKDEDGDDSFDDYDDHRSSAAFDTSKHSESEIYY